MKREGLEKWLLRQVEATSQSSVARLLGVNQSQVSRWVRGGGELRGVLRDAAVGYVMSHGIELERDEKATGQGTPVEEGGGRTGESGDGETVGEDDDSAAGDNTDVPDVADEDGTDGAKEHSSLLERIGEAETPSELAALASAPVLSEVSLDAARSGAHALARGWHWMRDPPPDGLHGDALFYLHTRENVSFEDEGAKRVAFAPGTEMFECGLTRAELRYGVHPRRRQRRYAVERREDREMYVHRHKDGVARAGKTLS